ncbi:3' terminal RNA ribose 2'-O-methyltransferase Hen1 [Kineosporia sp. A_224]|uniref:3' terminal RNA ribose 2'-O-methyltransferase Hen1 n=1 Tax=Kineosporia sp. A_224 TaxID=1962180 RepID=UPI000B4C1D8D|nr:3' terminal RNA ribose 2'-O-methyltransferase Hen1 [Kineosporia sp. A_224]
MLLTITASANEALPDATDLGYLLHKHPGRAQSFGVASGTVHVVYPEAAAARCTAALVLEVDPVALVRGRPGSGRRRSAPGGDGTLAQYVNDRPYAAGSLLAVALGQVFRTALAGRCDLRPDAAAAPLVLEVTVPVVPCRGGADLAERLFAPLGWTVEARPLPLDEEFPEWGDSRYVALRLTGTVRLAEALNHLYVLLPVLDDAKHYWVAADEVDKLVRAGTGWLATHPERGLITRRYLRRRHAFVRTALQQLAIERLADADDTDVDDVDNAVPVEEVAEVEEVTASEEPAAEAVTPEDVTTEAVTTGDAPDAERVPPPLAKQRIAAVVDALRTAGASSVLDLGCGEGALLGALLADRSFTRVVGADVSYLALQVAARRLRLDRMPERTRDRLELVQTALTYRDARLAGFDAAVLMEVVEHVDPPRLPALEAAVFGAARPRTVVVTTPNVEWNVRYGLEPGHLRHRDHRFEWTREEFRHWADGVAQRHGYAVTVTGVGQDDEEVGRPTQLGVFAR